MEIEDSSVEREADGTVECASVCHPQRILQPLHGPTCVGWQKFEPNTWDTVCVTQSIRPVVNDLHLNKLPVKLLNNDTCIFHQPLSDGEVLHEAAHAPSFQSKKVRRDTVVRKHGKVVGCDFLVRCVSVLLNDVRAVVVVCVGPQVNAAERKGK